MTLNHIYFPAPEQPILNGDDFERYPVAAAIVGDGLIIKLNKCASKLFGAGLISMPADILLGSTALSELNAGIEKNEKLFTGDIVFNGTSYQILGLIAGIHATIIFCPSPGTKTLSKNSEIHTFMRNIDNYFRKQLNEINASLFSITQNTQDTAAINYKLLRIEHIYLRILRACNNMRDLANLKDSLFTPEISRINLTELIENAVNETRSAYNDDVFITLNKGAPADIYIEGDSELLERLILNLLTNALEYSDFSDEIVVSLHSDNLDKSAGRVSLKVSNPTVMDSFIKKNAFSMYTAERDSYNAMRSGLGLGLPICDSIAKLHNGSILFDSAKGKGTTICVFLPLTHNKEPSISSRNIYSVGTLSSGKPLSDVASRRANVRESFTGVYRGRHHIDDGYQLSKKELSVAPIKAPRPPGKNKS